MLEAADNCSGRQPPRNGLSHVVGATEPPLLDLTIGDLLDRSAAHFPDRLAVVFSQHGVRWTWRELQATVDRHAAALIRLGLVQGDRLGIWSPNRAEWLVTMLATARLGVILVNINPAYRVSELEYAINKAGLKALVTAAQFKSSDYLAMLRTLAPELDACRPGELRSARLPELRLVIRLGDDTTPGMMNWGELDALADTAGVRAALAIGATLQPHQAINVQFTSGTTGHPKGATLTHLNIVNNAVCVGAAMRLGVDDRLAIPVPLYHCFGMVMGVLVCLSSGAAMVFPSEGFDAGLTLTAVAAERCTALHGVPTMFIAQLDHPDFAQHDLSSLRTGCMAGSPCPVEVMKRVVKEMHMGEVTIAYGMTETSPVSFQSDTADPLERRVRTVGRVQPHLEVKLIDALGDTVPVGEKGELCTRGYAVMHGYWGDEQRTLESVVDGWMHTGDLATLDAEGYCNIVGRVKDMLIRGGENVYPREVEEFLFAHPAVQQVQVFGVPDPTFGEVVCAWIVLKAGAQVTEADIQAHCRAQIAHFKVPSHVRFVSELPMTVTGKAQKFVMREAMMRELGVSETRTAWGMSRD